MPTLFFADLVRELCQGGGTGPLTPTGAVPGHRRFTDAVPVDTDFHYAIAGIAQPAQWEVGVGHVDAAGRLVRAAVAASSNDGERVAFAPGLKTLALTVGADWFGAQDAAVAALNDMGDDVAALTGALAAKQPISTTHATADTGSADDLVTVRRGGNWVNLPLSVLAYRGANGRVSVGAPVACVDGSAAAPSMTFASDSDTGLFRAGANMLGIATGGIERIRVSPSGDIGIGVDPANRFDVQTSAGRFSVGHSGAASVRLSSSGSLFYDTGAGSAHQFLNNGADGVTISSAGNMGIGTTVPENFAGYRVLHLAGSVGSQITMQGADLAVRSYIYAASTGFTIGTSTTHNLNLRTSNAIRLIVESGGGVRPGADNSQNLGAAAARWATIFAGTGTINTSDEREKLWRGTPTEVECRAARRIACELGFFQWTDAIAQKGTDGARLHFGVRAQAVWAILADEGLIDPLDGESDPTSRYAFLCHDGWDEERDGEGVLAGAAGDRFGIRPDQLALFVIAAQEARLAALEAAA